MGTNQGVVLRLEDLIERTHTLHEKTLPFRQDVLKDPIGTPLTTAEVSLHEPFKVASLYVTTLSRILTQGEQKRVYRAVYPHIPPGEKGEAEALIIQGKISHGYISLPGFHLIILLSEAEGAYFLHRKEGFWSEAYVQLLASTAKRLLISRYLLTPEDFGRRLEETSHEAGNAYTIHRIDETPTEIIYLYEHQPEALESIRMSFPPELTRLILHGNALFSQRLINHLHPGISVQPILQSATREQPEHVQLILTVQKARGLERILTFFSGIPPFLHQLLHPGRPYLFELARAGITPDITPYRELLKRLHAAPTAGLSTPISPPPDTDPLPEGETILDEITREARLHVKRAKERILEKLMGRAGFIRQELIRHVDEPETLEDILTSLHTFYQAIDPQDAVHGHSHRVGMLLTSLSGNVGLDLPTTALQTYLIGLLHDIGKLTIPPDVLLAPRRLNEAEWYAVSLHPWLGASILTSLPAGENVLINDIIRASVIINLYHHENWDGSGYPYGIPWRDAEHTPLPYAIHPKLMHEAVRLTTLLRIVDSLDAVLSKHYSPRKGERGYHITVPDDPTHLAAYLHEDFTRRAGVWYHPRVVQAVLPRLESILTAYQTLEERQGILILPWMEDHPAYAQLIQTLQRVQPFTQPTTPPKP